MHNSYEIHDAHGNKVDELSAVCARCGANIKYIFEFEGKLYGSTCIEVVSGIRPDNWEWVEGKANLQATRKSLAKKEAEKQERFRKIVAHEAAMKVVRETNAVKFVELINVLKNASRNNFDFCYSMALEIEEATVSTELDGIFSPNQFDIVREIWGKQTGGRKNSNAYKAATAEFDAKFEG